MLLSVCFREGKMKRAALLFATALALVFTSSANAADLAARPPMAALPPAFTWTGIFLGISGGTGWGNKEHSWDQDATLAAIAAQMPNPGAIPAVGGTLCEPDATARGRATCQRRSILPHPTADIEAGLAVCV